MRHGGIKQLQEWSLEERVYFDTLIARGLSTPVARKEFFKHYPGAHTYAQITLIQYVESDFGQKNVGDILEILREQALERSYSHKGSRLDALIEIAERTFRKIIRLDPKAVREFVMLCSEFRQQMEAISKEMGQLGAEGPDVISSIDAAIKLMRQASEMKAPDGSILWKTPDSSEPTAQKN